MNYTFKSCFAKEINEYLNIRKCDLANKTQRDLRYVLYEFDSFLCDNKVERDGLTESVISNWIAYCKEINRWSTVLSKISHIRKFINYLAVVGIKAYLPPITKRKDNYIPYVFSEDEIDKIFNHMDSMKYTKSQMEEHLHIKFPTMIRMMYGCGFRSGEVRNLKMKDIDLVLGTVRLKNTKYNIERLVPMHQSLTDILRKYCLLMGITNDQEAYVFSGPDKTKPITDRVIRGKYATVLKQLHMCLPGRGFRERGICLHCFRHHFAIKSFKQGEMNGMPLDSMVPYLSIYLGHKSLRETEKYLKFDPTEIYQETLEYFTTFTDGMFPEVDYEQE